MISAQEKKLKDLIEGMGAGHDQKAAKAQLTLRLYVDKLSGISYDEAILLVKEQNETLKHMSVHDPAFGYFIAQRSEMLRYATALNDHRTLGRHDHEFPVHAIVSVDNVAVECNFHIPQLNYYPFNRDSIIRSTLRQLISASSDWSGGFRHQAKTDFVEL